jgi:hypothetical protein
LSSVVTPYVLLKTINWQSWTGRNMIRHKYSLLSELSTVVLHTSLYHGIKTRKYAFCGSLSDHVCSNFGGRPMEERLRHALYNLQATSHLLSYFPYVESLALANTKRNPLTTHFCLLPISGISYVNKYREEWSLRSRITSYTRDYSSSCGYSEIQVQI